MTTMEGKRVPSLVSLAIKPSDLQTDVAEYGFNAYVEITKKPKDDPGMVETKQIINGLLNTCGGVVFVHDKNDTMCTDQLIEKLKNDLIGQMSTFLSDPLYNTCIKITGNTLPLTVIVTKSPRLVTLNSFLHIRDSVGNKTVHDADSIDRLVQQPSMDTYQDPLKDHTSLIYGEFIGKSESQCLEFKCWEACRTMQTYKQRLKDKRTRRSFFALANNPSGGDFILGIKEDAKSKMNCIVGQEMTEEHEIKLKDILINYLADNESQGIWGKEGSLPVYGEHWFIKFIPVEHRNDITTRRMVIQIHFNHCPGGVFEQVPEAYMVSEAGYIVEMSFNEWINRVGKQMLESVPEKPKIAQPISDGRAAQTSNTKKVEVTKFTSKTAETKVVKAAPDARKENKPQRDVKEMNDKMYRKRFLSWTDNKENWSGFVKQIRIEIQENVESFITNCDVTRTKKPINFTPSRKSILAAGPPKEQMERCLKYIEDHTPAKAFGIATKHWLLEDKIFDLSVPHKVMDIFILDETCSIQLWALLDVQVSDDDMKVIWHHLMTKGRITKKRMSEKLQSDKALQIAVQCFVHVLDNGNTSSRSDVQIQQHLTVTGEEHFLEVKRALAEVLLEQKTEISNNFGDHMSVLLTAQQMRNLLDCAFNKFNYIEGPPGSGKTFLALYVCGQYNKEDVCVISTTTPFQSFLKFQEKSSTLLAENEEQLLGHIQSGRLQEFTCVILDDAHNLLCSEATLEELYTSILESPTRLFIFADSQYQNYLSLTNAKQMKRSLSTFCIEEDLPYSVNTLKDIHRNTQKIASFIRTCFSEKSRFAEPHITCSRADEGDDVDIRRLDRMVCETENNSLVELVKSLIKPQLLGTGGAAVKQYQPWEIALLVDVGDSPETELETVRRIFSKQLSEYPHQSADVFPVQHLTIDVLDKFLGLDRPVCICIPSTRSERGFMNERYKAFIASRGIQRVIFAVETLDMDVANLMKIDKMPFLESDYPEGEPLEKRNKTAEETDLPESYGEIPANCVHLNQGEEIFDVCFLHTDQGVRILYATHSKVYAVTEDGRQTDLPVDITVVKVVRRLLTSPNKRSLGIIHCAKSWKDGPWWWTVYHPLPGGGWFHKTYPLHRWLWAACWGSEEEVVMSFQEGSDFTMTKYHVDGRTLWNHVTNIKMIWALMAGNSGTIYATDIPSHCIRVFSAEGNHLRNIPASPDPDALFKPQAACMDSTGKRIFVIEGKSSDPVLTVINIEDNVPHTIMTLPSYNIVCQQLFNDDLLAMGTTNGFYLFKISDSKPKVQEKDVL